MATLLCRSFEAVTESAPSYAPDGSYIPGTFSVRSVRGTVQPMSGMETVPAVAASRNTGTAKVYSSERLAFRREGESSGRGYVRLGGALYELVDELPNRNGLVSHWKYVACLVPPSQVPEALK